MLALLSIGRYPTQVSYDDRWSILSNTRQLLPNIDSSYIKSENVSIAHLRTYLTIVADWEDDITIARTFILFMKGHLWFQMANDTVPLGYLAAVANLDSAALYDWGSAILASLYHGLDTAITTGGVMTGFVQLLTYWFYEYCGAGHPIVKEEVKLSAYPRLRAWERGNRRKTNDQATNLFMLGRYHIDHRTVETITWEPWLDSVMSETEDVMTAKLLPKKGCHFKYQMETLVVKEDRETYASYWAKQTLEIGYILTNSQRTGNIDLFGPTAFRAGITLVVVTSTSVHSAYQDFSLPGEAEGPDPGWQINSIDHQLYAHDQELRRGRDVRVVPLPPRGGARTRQRGSGPHTWEAGTSRRGWGTGDESE
ncbi:hypothetical protein GIB67_037001 [Kingdonia uniflora]|uniref:Aminotransferase-like plant mobile domain-containing protein n=1 Tax=Kingdonia uniflora TaxID=39325 RepID=A0A7J7LHH1_9MAGN|nr:hypothetical protein GIB67_037001 [Kingdonia uniflora]